MLINGCYLLILLIWRQLLSAVIGRINWSLSLKECKRTITKVMIIRRCAWSIQIDPSLNGYGKNISREILLEYMHVLYTTYLHYNTLYKYFQLYNTESPSMQNSNLILIYIMKLPNICLRSHCYKKCQITPRLWSHR